MRNPFPPFILVDIVHQVETPGHGENRSRASEDGDKGTGLDRSRMDEIRLDLFGQTSKVEGQREKFAPRKWFASALPDHLVDILRHRAAFDLPLVAFELDKVHLMPAF